MDECTSCTVIRHVDDDIETMLCCVLLFGPIVLMVLSYSIVLS